MITKNYARWGAGVYAKQSGSGSISGKVYVKNIEGTLKTQSYNDNYVAGDLWLYTASLFNDTSLRSLTTGKGTSMFLGTGNTTETKDDYKLDSILEFSEDGLTVLSETLNHIVDEDTFYNYVLTVKNNSAEAITISESGMISTGAIGNNSNTLVTFLWARDTFEPVTLQPGDTRAFTMTIGLE